MLLINLNSDYFDNHIRTIDRRKRMILAMDVALGMEYLHEKNIVHFDLKSNNLLVNMRDPRRPVCKVIDLLLSIYIFPLLPFFLLMKVCCILTDFSAFLIIEHTYTLTLPLMRFESSVSR